MHLRKNSERFYQIFIWRIVLNCPIFRYWICRNKDLFQNIWNYTFTVAIFQFHLYLFKRKQFKCHLLWKGMDVNEHKLSLSALRYKLKKRNNAFIAGLHFVVLSSIINITKYILKRVWSGPYPAIVRYPLPLSMNSTSVTLCRLMLFDVKTIKSQIWGYQQENKIRSRGLTTIVIIVHIALRCYKKNPDI